MTMRCPMLEGTSCIIHDMRPVVCRAYGVTTYAVDCTRPLGKNETPTKRAANTGMQKPIRDLLNNMLVEFAKEDRFAVTTGYLPTLLLSRLSASKFAGLVDEGKVHPMKIVRGYITSPAIIGQYQIADFTLAGDEALQEVERNGINTGPVMLKI